MGKMFRELPIIGIKENNRKEEEEIILKGSIDMNSVIMFCEIEIDGKKYTELHTIIGTITIPVEYDEFKILYTHNMCNENI